MHDPLLTRYHSVDRHLSGVRRPDDGPVGVRVSGGAFPGEHGVVAGVRAHFPVGHVVVLDEDLARAVRRDDRVRAQIPPKLAGARRPGHAARADAAPSLSPGRALVLALIGVEVAPPGEVVCDELDGLPVVGELDAVEGEVDRRDRVVCEGGEAREGRCEAFVIEGGALGLGFGVDEDEVVAALDRLAVPEPGGLVDPGGALGDVDDQTLEALAEAVGSGVVGEGALGGGGEGGEKGGEEEEQGEAVREGANRHGSGLLRGSGAAMSGLKSTRDVMCTLQFVNCSVLFCPLRRKRAQAHAAQRPNRISSWLSTSKPSGASSSISSGHRCTSNA